MSGAVGQVTVVGSGLAGLSATLTLARAGVCVTLVSAQPSERAQSVMAEGGINAALDLAGENDSPEQHFADTMKSAAGLSDPNAVWGMTKAAPGIVRELIGLGVPFQVEGGHMVQRYFGGQKKRRTAYAKSSTGKALVSALIDAVRAYEAAGTVTRLSHHEVEDVLVADDVCQGVVVRDAFTSTLQTLPAPVILATGGLSGIFGPRTTGTTTNTGHVAALCLSRGVKLSNLEMVQYHPTTVAIPGKRMLVSEAARGEGGRLCTIRDGKTWYFMEERSPELGNLMPRDVVSREEASILADPSCDGQVYLDMRALSRHVWRRRLSDLREECIHYLGIDPARQLLPVEPGIHYSMGGIHVDEGHRTSTHGLYAAGECCSQYHGANRLGGNSLLGAIYGGRVAGQSVLADGFVPEGAASAAGEETASGCQESAPREVADILAHAMGIVRDGAELEAAARQLGSMGDDPMTMLARALVESALARTESRGAHFRSDYPQRDEGMARVTVARIVDGSLRVALEDLPMAREGVPALGGSA